MRALFNRLYVKVYLTIVSSLFLVVIVSAILWRSSQRRPKRLPWRPLH